jgi:hypothetical protein
VLPPAVLPAASRSGDIHDAAVYCRAHLFTCTVPSMEGDVVQMLDELCVKLGLCLDPAARSRIALKRFRDEDSLEEAVLEAEGIDPLKMDRRRRDELREIITRYWN